MLKQAQLVSAVAILLCCTVVLPFAASAQAPPDVVSLLVKLVSGLSPEEQAAVVVRNGGVEISSIPALRLHVVEVLAADLPTVLINYQSDPQVAHVEENKVRRAEALPSDPIYLTQWALPKIAWDRVFGAVVPTGSATVALLDTGVDALHPDLAGTVVPGISMLDNSEGLTDPSGHGTWLAGIVAGHTDTVPMEGIAGVAYAGVQIVPVTVLDVNGEGRDSDVIAGVIWATDNGANVILMAFSNPGFSPNLQEAIDYAWSRGVVLVAAVGNDGVSTPTFPAGNRGVIGVSSTDSADSLLGFSNFGEAVFLAAPGVDIATTALGNAYSLTSGTSTSAAIVAGVAAFMKAVDATLHNGVIANRLARTADPAGTPEQTGNGRVNMARAIADTSTDSIQPAGADPVGAGGPFVGPYVAAARNFEITVLGAGSGSVTITVNAEHVSFNTTGTNACTGTGNGTASVTITATCKSLRNSSNDAIVTLTAAADSSAFFAGWSNVTGDLFTCLTNPNTPTCSNVLGGGQNKITVTFNAKAVTGLAVSDATGTFGAGVTLTATLTAGGSGLNGKTISFTLNGSTVGTATTNGTGVATLSNVSLASINADTYNTGVRASFAGDTTNLAVGGTGKLTVTPRPITATADTQNKIYGEADPALTYQITSGSLVTGDSVSGALTRVTGEAVGTYAIQQGTLTLGSNYTLTFAGADLRILPRPITVTAHAKTKGYGEADPALTYQITSGSQVGADSFTGALTRAAGETVAGGPYAIQQGTLALNGNYTLTYVGATLTITRRPVTVMADAQGKIYGGTDPALTYQIVSGSLAFSDTFTGALTRVTGQTVAGSPYAIQQGTLTLGSNYILTFVGANLTITPRPIAVTADHQTKMYGNADPALTYQITSGSLAFSDAFTGALSRLPGESVGTYAIQQGTLALGSNYALTLVGANLSITPRPAAVTPNAASKTYGDPDPSPLTTGTLTGFVAGDGVSATYSRTAGEMVAGSPYTISATLSPAGVLGNYSITYNTATFTINRANQTITFGTLADRSPCDPPFGVSATGGASGNPVMFSILSGPATVSGDVVTLTGAGAVTVRASQAGNANYNPAANVDRTFNVGALGFNGFLPPVGGADANGGSYSSTLRTFKLGSTIPVKFTASCNGAPVLGGIHTLQAIKYTDSIDADLPIDATPTDAATTGNQFRLTDGEWHFNVSTKAAGFTQGTWKLIATLSDGTTHHVWITLKK